MADHADNSQSFLRLAQIIALDCARKVGPESRWGVDAEVLAWWNDDDGMWLITRPEPGGGEGCVDLVQYWKAEVGLPWTQTVEDGGDVDMDIRAALEGRYRKGVEVLKEVGRCLNVSLLSWQVPS
jgi:hypothetical protein